MSVMFVMRVGSGYRGRSRSCVVTLAYMVRDHLATTVIAAFQHARAQRIDADQVLVVMNGGTLGNIVDVGMMDTG